MNLKSLPPDIDTVEKKQFIFFKNNSFFFKLNDIFQKIANSFIEAQNAKLPRLLTLSLPFRKMK